MIVGNTGITKPIPKKAINKFNNKIANDMFFLVITFTYSPNYDSPLVYKIKNLPRLPSDNLVHFSLFPYKMNYLYLFFYFYIMQTPRGREFFKSLKSICKLYYGNIINTNILSVLFTYIFDHYYLLMFTIYSMFFFYAM